MEWIKGKYTSFSERLARHRTSPTLFFLNLSVVVSGIIAVACADWYFNSTAVAAAASDVSRSACERLITGVNEMLMLPIVINNLNVHAFERGDIPLLAANGSALDGQPEGRVTNLNDFHFVSQLQAYPSFVSYIYVATESGYYVGAARRPSRTSTTTTTTTTTTT
eukprot:Rmarinus@m.26323